MKPKKKFKKVVKYDIDETMRIVLIAGFVTGMTFLGYLISILLEKVIIFIGILSLSIFIATYIVLLITRETHWEEI